MKEIFFFDCDIDENFDVSVFEIFIIVFDFDVMLVFIGFVNK